MPAGSGRECFAIGSKENYREDECGSLELGLRSLLAASSVRGRSAATTATNIVDDNMLSSHIVETPVPRRGQWIAEKDKQESASAKWHGKPCRRVTTTTTTTTCSSPSSTTRKYSIVASQGELARNNLAKSAREPSAATTTLRNGIGINNRESILASGIRARKDKTCAIFKGKHVKSDGFQEQTSKLVVSSSAVSRSSSSSSLPDGSAKGLSGVSGGKGGGTVNLVKKSSSLLFGVENQSTYQCGELASPSRSRDYLKSYRSILNQFNLIEKSPPVQKSASVETLNLPTSWKKSKCSGNIVKKSVSFSFDTRFERNRQTPAKNTAIHEAKLYHKGVLLDRGNCNNTLAKVPPSWKEESGDPAALLRAAREADDALIKEIISRAQKLGPDAADNVNIADCSGRTAISYMAGNGAPTMLEAILSFTGADPNIPDNEGNTPLHFAAQAGQTDCLNILLQKCPDIEVDARNTLGFTPLMKAALQGRTKCAKILLFAGANPTLRDHGRGLRAEQWARFCGRYVCAEVIERFARHRLLERTTSCRWGSEPELAAKVLQGKLIPVPTTPTQPPSTSSGLKSKFRKVFRTNSGPGDRNFSLVSQLTTAALCASSPALPKPGDVPPVVKSLLRPLSVPQLRVTLVAPQDVLLDKSPDVYDNSFMEKIENAMVKPSRSKKKHK
ncbi:uncharacterized protein [Prorops nasuta]|uniref:uncharacterized protein n=1 Tax=Prorops nasuta TaxID=863751 RepID=UPI0034CF64FD